MRSFNDWWSNDVPLNIQSKLSLSNEHSKPMLNQVNSALLHLHLEGRHDAKPTLKELREWVHTGQVDVLRTKR